MDGVGRRGTGSLGNWATVVSASYGCAAVGKGGRKDLGGFHELVPLGCRLEERVCVRCLGNENYISLEVRGWGRGGFQFV